MEEFGPEIAVDGMPDWIDGDELIMGKWSSGWYDRLSARADCYASPWDITAIRLRTDHPYYTATEKGFTYWPGGEDAPDDWDGGDTLLRNGALCPQPGTWAHGVDRDIIGYRKRSEPIDSHMNQVHYNAPFTSPNRPSDELVKRLTDVAREAEQRLRYCADHYSDGNDTQLAQKCWGIADDLSAILSELKPIDPVVKRAREICAKTTNSASQKRQFSDGELDDGLSMEAVIRALREGM